MPENRYPQLPSAPSMSQESFNIEMVRKYYQDIANLNPSGAKGGGVENDPPRFFLCSIC